MEIVMHRPWKISVHAKAKNFDLKFTASKILTSWEFLEARFSILIKVHSFLLRLRSETGGGSDTSVATQIRRRRRRNKRSLKSKFLTYFDRLISTTTLKRIRLNKVVEDFVEKRRGTGRFTYGFLSLLEKFRVKRGVRNRAAAPPPGNKIRINLGYSENEFREMLRRRRREIRYREELMMMMMGSLLVGYLLIYFSFSTTTRNGQGSN